MYVYVFYSLSSFPIKDSVVYDLQRRCVHGLGYAGPPHRRLGLQSNTVYSGIEHTVPAALSV